MKLLGDSLYIRNRAKRLGSNFRKELFMKKSKEFKITPKMKAKIAAMFGSAVIGGSLLISGGTAHAAVSAGVQAYPPVLNAKVVLDPGQQQIHLQNIISKGNEEIARRLTTLDTLSGKIESATKLTPSDQATLNTEVNGTISGLTSLKTQLDSENSLLPARNDAISIYTEYRVYALVAPKVGLIKVADDQQVIEAKLSALVPKLQSRITEASANGSNVTTMQAQLTDMSAKISAAQAISSNIESTVINLQPMDYNSNHSVLVGDNTELKTAYNDIQTAYNDAKAIVSELKAL
jgi:hypothetical protein